MLLLVGGEILGPGDRGVAAELNAAHLAVDLQHQLARGVVAERAGGEFPDAEDELLVPHLEHQVLGVGEEFFAGDGAGILGGHVVDSYTLGFVPVGCTATRLPGGDCEKRTLRDRCQTKNPMISRMRCVKGVVFSVNTVRPVELSLRNHSRFSDRPKKIPD